MVGTSDPAARRPRLHALDLMRVIAVIGVIAVHVVSFTNPVGSVAAGGVTVLLHVSREVFITVTALVLTYSRSHDGRRSLWRFWGRRYWLVGVPYLAWTVLYFLADGGKLSPLPKAVADLGRDLATGTARYHLYFLLVTMQLYLIFPGLAWLIRVTRRHHRWLLMVSLLIQLAFTAAIHQRVVLPGPLGTWLAHPDALLPSYQFYVLLGGVMADHVEELTTWVRRHLGLVAMILLVGVGVGVGSYIHEVSLVHMAPLQAAEVFQPAVTLESLAVVLGLYTLGAFWAEWLRPRWLARLVDRCSDASFGIYLAHPLVLQWVLTLGLLAGLLGRLVAARGGIRLAIGALVVVPVVFSIAWGLTLLTRRSPLSVVIAGRPMLRAPSGQPRHWSSRSMGTVGVAIVLVAALQMTRLVASAPTTMGVASTNLPSPVHTLSPAPTSSRRQVALPTGTSSMMQTITVDGIPRSYQVIRPIKQVSPTVPVILALHGIGETIDLEAHRDGLLPLAASGQAILVYPVGYHQSWNAGTCCGDAQGDGVDDVAFLSAVVHGMAESRGVDPNGIYLVGFSNGGRMAYRLVCDKPQLLHAVAVVAALPDSDCPSGPPVALLQVANAGDTVVPLLQTQAQVATWRSRNHCTAASSSQRWKQLVVQRWSTCRQGATVEFATYAGDDHIWPSPSKGTPPPSDVIWKFFAAQQRKQ